MRKSLLALLVVALAGCSALAIKSPGTSLPASPSLPDLGPAPELENEVWLNTEQPLRLSDLRGQVVLLDMWTFG